MTMTDTHAPAPLPQVEAARRVLETAIGHLIDECSHGPAHSAAQTVEAAWDAYALARTAPANERFTNSDMRVIAEAFAPECCHVSGEHDPTHYVLGRRICEIQAAGALYRGLDRLGIAKPHPDDVRPAEHCGWCSEDGAPRRTGPDVAEDHEHGRRLP